MLIISERHKKEDMELWKEYEELDTINSVSIKLFKKENEARDSIQDFVKDKPAYVGVSWGKDSVVVADLCLRNNINLPLVHLYCIPSHSKECDLVRDSFFKIHPHADYHEIICDYGSIYARNLSPTEQDIETDKVWYKTWKKVNHDVIDRHISGIRKEESGIRRMRMGRFGISTEHTCAPIGYWTHDDVFAYLKKYDLPVHPNYAMLGNGRWDRKNIRVAEIGDIHGTGFGRSEWEREYYPDILARLARG
ncbi:MAG: phosphoadenosine phosphosulfate reductase family protein [Treponema sp.]|jgi:phosphoadenosine phosphosulfate reductase|nr:phosphoadenosine phosphosulfate reductase family protein [Treponema sp.]